MLASMRSPTNPRTHRQGQGWSSRSCRSSARAGHRCRQSQPHTSHLCRCCDLLGQPPAPQPSTRAAGVAPRWVLRLQGGRGAGLCASQQHERVHKPRQQERHRASSCPATLSFFMSHQEVLNVSPTNCNFNINTDIFRQGENISFQKKNPPKSKGAQRFEKMLKCGH